MAEDGVWKTIRGRHVYIRNKENLQDAIKKRKEEIQSYRNEAKKQISNVREGKERYADLDKASADYSYKKGKNGEAIKDKEGYYTIIPGPKGKKYIEEQKILYSWEGPDYNEQYSKEEETALKLQREYEYNRNYQTRTAKEFKDRLKRGQIKDTKINDIVYNANAAVGGNWKTEDERIGRLKKLETQMDTVYSKTPINVSESDFKTFNKPMMQDALNDLYLTQVQSENANTKIRGWKAKANPNTPQGRKYQDIIEDTKYGNAKEQIERVNNTDFYVANGYIGRMTYIPEYDELTTDVHNLNKRDRLDYPDVYKTSNEKEYGVNWAAMGTMSTKNTREYANRLKKASDFADAMTNMEASTLQNFKSMDAWQVKEMFKRQGYSDATAEKLAKEYLNKRKRK